LKQGAASGQLIGSRRVEAVDDGYWHFADINQCPLCGRYWG